MEKKRKRKGRVFKRLIVFNSMVLLLTMPINALAVNALVGSDNMGDLLEFDKDYLDEMGEDIYDFEDFEDISEETFIEQSNEFYTEINNKRSEAKVVDAPKDIDIASVDFDNEEYELTINMNKDINLDDDESMIGFIWNAEVCYVFIVVGDSGIYVRPDHSNYTDLTIENNYLIFEDVGKDFHDEEYVKAIIIYSNDNDVYVVEMFYNHEASETLVFWLIIFILIAVIAVIAIAIYYKKKGE